MVDNTLEGEASGHILAKELCALNGYDGAIALRNPIDAILFAMELAETDELLMPILVPHVLSSRLNSVSKKLQFYDIDIATMLPVFHSDYPIRYGNKMMKLAIRYLGGKLNSQEQLPQEFDEIPTIELSWSFDKSIVQQLSKRKDKEGQNSIDTQTKNSSGNKASQFLKEKKSEFLIVILENNTMLTAGGGAVLLVSGKNRASALKKKVTYLQSWMALTDFNAGLALAQIKQLSNFVSRIDNILPLYKDAIQRGKHSALPIILHREAIPQCFPIMISSRVNEVTKYIRKQGIECIFPFQTSTLGIMMETLTNDKEKILASYTHGTRYVTNVIGLPCYPALANEEVSKIVSIIASLP